jgi:hypothetical protein
MDGIACVHVAKETCEWCDHQHDIVTVSKSLLPPSALLITTPPNFNLFTKVCVSYVHDTYVLHDDDPKKVESCRSSRFGVLIAKIIHYNIVHCVGVFCNYELMDGHV